MDKDQIERKKKEEKEVRRIFNEKYQVKTENKEKELPLGQTKHRFDIYERGKFIGGISTSPWKNKTGSNNSGGQDRASTELLWLTLWGGLERRVMIPTDEDMAERLFKRWQGCSFIHSIEIIHCDLIKRKLITLGVLGTTQQSKKAIHKGDKVKIVRLSDDVDDMTKEYVSCFLGCVGIVKTEPKWMAPAPEKGPLGKIFARGECWVEFDKACQRHGDTGGAFEVSELEKIEG